jgi:HEAT repeat protein
MAFVKPRAAEPVEAGEREGGRRCADLAAGLDDESPEARRRAARELALCPEAAPALAARIKTEKDASVREAIFTSLVRIGDPSSVGELVECLRSDDAFLRNEAVDAMRQLPDEVAPIMGDLLRDHDPDTRILAVNILESFRHPDVEAWLIEVIASDPHVNVCATAADLLVELGTDAAIDALEGLKLRFADEPFIRFSVDIALKRIRESL